MGLGAAIGPVAPVAARAGSVPVVGVLHQNAGPRSGIADAVRAGLRELGYVEGRTIAVDVRFGGRARERLPAAAAELVRRKVDVLVAIGPAALKAAAAATTSIPIVAVDLESDPVDAGYVRSIAHPGGNVTGLFLDLPGLTRKLLELIKEVGHGIQRAAILRDVSAGPWQLAAARAAAQRLGLDIQVLEIGRPDDVAQALDVCVKDKSQALVELSSPLLNSGPLEAQVAAFAIKHRLPTISMFRTFAQNGGLLAYGPDQRAYLRRVAACVDKVLKGASAAEVPIEQPTMFEFAVNLRTAKAIGLTLPPSLLQRATEVIQ